MLGNLMAKGFFKEVLLFVIGTGVLLGSELLFKVIVPVSLVFCGFANLLHNVHKALAECSVQLNDSVLVTDFLS